MNNTIERCPICEEGITRKTKGDLLGDGYFICNNCLSDLRQINPHIARHLMNYTKDNIKGSLKEDLQKLEVKRREEKELEENQQEKKLEQLKEINKIIVTTGDTNREYVIIGPIYFQVSNKGFFSSTLKKLKKKYQTELRELKNSGMESPEKSFDWGFLYGEYSFGMNNEFDAAFFVSVKEMQKRAHKIGADAVVWMKQDIDLDTANFQYFYLQMYGTAVKFKTNNP